MISRFRWGVLAFSLIIVDPAGGQVRKSTGNNRLDQQINQALVKGTAFLVKMLPNLNDGDLALALLAAFDGGADRQDPVVQASLKRIINSRAAGTYAAGLMLMIYQKYGGTKAEKALARTIKKLLSWQNADGGWGYGRYKKTRSDTSCTQYALLGLRAVYQAKKKISRKVIERTVSYLLKSEAYKGGFCYVKGRRQYASPNMTAGTLGSLEICRELLGKKGFSKTTGAKVDGASLRGTKYLGGLVKREINRGRINMQKGYFLYALERAMVLKGMEVLGGVSWYEIGARYLVDGQKVDGSWSSDYRSSAFAVLFLARTFRRLGDVTMHSPEDALLRLKDSASIRAVKTLAHTLANQGMAAVPSCLKVIWGKSKNQRTAAALALEKITGIVTGFDPAGDPTGEANQNAGRIWVRWWLTRRKKAPSRKGL